MKFGKAVTILVGVIGGMVATLKLALDKHDRQTSQPPAQGKEG